MSVDTRRCPKLDGEKHNPEPAWDKGGSKRKIVVEVEGLLGSRIGIVLIHDELNQFGLLVLPKRIGQAAEQIEQGQVRRWR